MKIKKEKLVDMFRTLVRIRCCEERLVQLFPGNKVPGFISSAIGQEATYVGAIANLKAGDYVTGTHRGRGYHIAQGGKIERIMAEMYGKSTGYCRGKGGPMHVADLEVGYLGSQAVVGSGITIANGAALSAKMRGTDQVTLCFFGDGAANTGRFHEGINLGSIWKLPIVYVCENNLYAFSVAHKDSMNLDDIADRGSAYGIPGIVVDGNDVIAVYQVVGNAVARARKGEGPSLIECKTYRLRGQYEGDPATYRPKEEVEEWRKKEPVKRFREQLIKMEALTEETADQIVKAAEEEVDKAVKFAEESPFPDPEEALEDMYA